MYHLERNCNTSVRISGSYAGIAEGSGLLGLNAMSLGEWFALFGTNVVSRILD